MHVIPIPTHQVPFKSKRQIHAIVFELESRLIVVVLYQDRTTINDNGLPGAESFLHQKQIGLRYIMSLADSANRETLSHAFV